MPLAAGVYPYTITATRADGVTHTYSGFASTDVNAIVLESAPLEIKANESFDIVLSSIALEPTLENISIKYIDQNGPVATINSRTGSGPWTINATFPNTIDLKFSEAGYPLYIEVAEGNVEFPYDSARATVAGAYYVDPVNGSDTNDGLSEGAAWLDVSQHLETLPDNSTVYLMNGTHTPSSIAKDVTKYWSVNGITITSLPGHTPVIDLQGSYWMVIDGLSNWTVSHIKITNYLYGIWLGDAVVTDGFTMYSVDGETGIGGDNTGLVKIDDATNYLIDRVRAELTVDPSTVHHNTANLYINDAAGTSTGVIDHFESYNTQSGIYFKHGNGSIAAHNGNVTVRNSFLHGSLRSAIGYNAAGVKFENTIFHTDVNLSEADGGEAGDWNWFDHCTFYANLNLRDQLTGATNNRLTNSIITTLDINGSSSVTSDSDYNLFVNNIEDGATSRDLASWQTANSSDANSLQGTPAYTGSDFSLIESYALANGSIGENASSTASDVGADASLIGVLA